MPRIIDSIEDAIASLSLLKVSFYEQSAKREEINPGQMTIVPTGDADANIDIELGYRTSESGIDYRCQLSVAFEGANIRVDAAASYRSKESVELSDEIIADFGDNVAIMMLLPYVRQAVSDLGSRIGYEMTLPIIQRGELRLDVTGLR